MNNAFDVYGFKVCLNKIINALLSVAQSIDKESAYNADDIIEGNLTQNMGTILPDME